jgi:predicted secreted protein
MAKKGFGSILSILSGSAFVEIGELLTIGGPSYSKETIDTTHMQSADEFKEYLAGLRDAGEISASVSVDLLAADGKNHIKLLESLETDDAPVQMKCQFGTVAIFSINGIVTAFEPEAPLDGKQEASITIKISGKPTLADVA